MTRNVNFESVSSAFMAASAVYSPSNAGAWCPSVSFEKKTIWSEFLQCRIQRLTGDVQVEFDRLGCARTGPDDAQGGNTEQRLQHPAETEGRQIWLAGATPW